MPTNKYLLIDGYNVIHKIPELAPSLQTGLENARLKLALLISAWRPSHPSTECVIIFDGSLQFSGTRDQRLAGIRCIFSQAAHGADDEIIRLVREARAQKHEITVVSDDNKVGNNCRAHGASVQPSSYLQISKTGHPKAGAKTSLGSKGIDRKTAAEIDRELKKIFGL
jgi:predicted RNA-binding protein with PIN domain